MWVHKSHRKDSSTSTSINQCFSWKPRLPFLSGHMQVWVLVTLYINSTARYQVKNHGRLRWEPAGCQSKCKHWVHMWWCTPEIAMQTKRNQMIVQGLYLGTRQGILLRKQGSPSHMWVLLRMYIMLVVGKLTETRRDAFSCPQRKHETVMKTSCGWSNMVQTVLTAAI